MLIVLFETYQNYFNNLILTKESELTCPGGNSGGSDPLCALQDLPPRRLSVPSGSCGPKETEQQLLQGL